MITLVHVSCVADIDAIPICPEIIFKCIFPFGWKIVVLVVVADAICKPHRCVIEHTGLVKHYDTMLPVRSVSKRSVDIGPVHCSPHKSTESSSHVCGEYYGKQFLVEMLWHFLCG